MKIKKICCLIMVMVFLFICGCGKANDTIKEPVKELTKEETVKEFLIKMVKESAISIRKSSVNCRLLMIKFK